VTAGPAQAFTCHQGLVSNGSDYLDDYGGGSGKYVHTYPYTDSPNQQWCLEVASQGGYYFHPANNYGLCLDAHTYNSGQQIWVYTCNGTLPQRWCWDGTTGYIVTRGNSSMALRDRGTYNIVAIYKGGNNQWHWSGNTTPPPDHC
jgi:Ricin-type beta-trefoil lectin domain